MTSSTNEARGAEALVIFHDGPDGHWLDPLLKKGFRHCFCAVLVDGYWIEVNGCSDGTVVRVIAGTDSNLKEYYETNGCTVLSVERGGALKLPLVLSNCVGIVKATLGLGHFGVVTPYQLYRRILTS
jgi:hypothetical protein